MRVAVLVAIMIVPAASAASIEAQLDVAGWQAQGGFSGEVRVAGWASDHRLTTVPDDLVYSWPSWQASIYASTYAAAGPDARDPILAGHAPEEHRQSWSSGGNIRIVEWGPKFSVRVAPADADRFIHHDTAAWSNVTAGAGIDHWVLKAGDPRGAHHENLDHSFWPVTSVSRLTGPVNATAHEAVWAYFYDVTVEFDDGERLRVGPTPSVPSAVSHVRGEEREYLVLKAQGASLQGEWLWLVRSMNIDLNGTAQWLDADGDLTIDGDQQPWNRSVLAIQGLVTGEMRATSTGSHWRIGGDAAVLGIDGVQVVSPVDHTAEVVATATVAALVFAALWKFGSRILALCGWSREPLGNPHRARIAELVTWQPGLSPMQIARRTGLARTSVRRHLVQLQQAGLLSQYGKGKISSYALNSGSSRFQIGDLEVNAADVFAVQRHPIKRRILESAREGSVDYASFREAHPELDVARSTFSEHARDLAAMGILERRVLDRRAMWESCLDPEVIRRHYVHAFLVRRNWWCVYEQVQEAKTEEDLIERLEMRKENLRSILASLKALGLVHGDASQTQARPF